MGLASNQLSSVYHLNFARKFMLLLGIWPINRDDWLEVLYELYFLTTFIYYIVFNISSAALAVLTWSDNYLTTASSMGIVIEYMSNAYKVSLFKSRTFKGLIREINERERQILDSNNEQVKRLYVDNTVYNRKVVLFYTIMGTVGISLYFITPLVSNALNPLGFNNETGVQNHYFIVFSWFPFDPNQYYWAAYLIQFTGCLIGYSYIVYCGALYISILSYVKVQLQIIQHFFINLSRYSKEYERLYSLSLEQARFVLLRLLVQEHLKIIDFVERLNDTLKIFTLLNFVISSFQLSLLTYQIFYLNPLMQQLTVLSYFITLTTQLVLSYQAAHMIVVESTNTAYSLFKGDWHTYSPQTLRVLQMVCLRAQRPLAMTIGPIAQVKVTALIQIFKALYSYMCIMMKI